MRRPDEMSNDRHSRPTGQNDSLPASTVMGGKHVGPIFRCAVSAPRGVALDCLEDRVDRCRRCQEAVGSARTTARRVRGAARHRPGAVAGPASASTTSNCCGCARRPTPTPTSAKPISAPPLNSPAARARPCSNCAPRSTISNYAASLRANLWSMSLAACQPTAPGRNWRGPRPHWIAD